MSYFIFKVKDEEGRSIQGLMEAATKADVKRRLRNTKFFFISAEPYAKKNLARLRITFKSLLMFTHRLSTLIEAGVPILSAMNILWKQTEDKTLQLVVSHIKIQLEDGNKISTTLEAFPRIFPVVYRSMISVGETSATLVAVLRKLCDYLDYRSKITANIKRAITYPMVVLIFSLLVIIGMFVFVVPAFENFLLKLKGDLPFITKAVMGFSHLLRSGWFYIGIVVAVVGLTAAYRAIRNNKQGAYLLDKIILKIPYLGDLILIISMSQFIRSLSILLGAGVSALESLEVSKSTTGNAKIVRDIDLVKEQIEHGTSFYDSFRKIKYFPLTLLEMIGVGESSGSLVQMLDKICGYFDEEVDYHVNRFITLLEPFLVIFIGGIVLITMLSIYLPILKIWEKLM